ncbi:hypothetical protein N9L68_00125 [bacterium]|nr:hypothetical protein [bacterium]
MQECDGCHACHLEGCWSTPPASRIQLAHTFAHTRSLRTVRVSPALEKDVLSVFPDYDMSAVISSRWKLAGAKMVDFMQPPQVLSIFYGENIALPGTCCRHRLSEIPHKGERALLKYCVVVWALVSRVSHPRIC